MALPSNQYIAWQGVETYFVNKITGLPLSAGYVKFFSDVARTVPKNVFQQVQSPGPTYSFVNIGSTINLSAVGTFMSPNDGTNIQVYAYPYDANGAIELYYMEIYSSDNILQFTREAQPANFAAGQNIDTFEGSENQIENSQFVETFLPYTLTNTFSVSGTGTVTSIAPDWSLVTNGTGDVIVTQLPLSDIAMPSGAPFAIQISSTGITSLKLRQQISQSPRMFGNGSSSTFIYGSLVAKSFTGAAIAITMDYVASNGYTANLVTGSTSADGNFNTLANLNATTINSTNTNTPLTPGYVNIDITIPTGTNVGITSVQVASVNAVNATTAYIPQSVPRQIDHLFHYYKSLLAYKPIPSYLVGWDFPLNPSQFGTTGSTGAIGSNKSAYAWDQTILFSSVTNGLTYARAGGDTALALQVTPANNTSWAMIQYLPVTQARELLTQRMAVALRGYSSTGSVNGTVSLWYTRDANLPSVIAGTNNSLVTSIAAGVPTCGNGTWVQVPRLLGNAIFSMTGTLTDYSFKGWEEPLSTSTVQFIAIVVAFDTTLTTQDIVLDYVSLMQGDIATRPAPKTKAQVLAECQYYYEKSYAPTVNPGTAIAGGCLYANQKAITNGGNTEIQITGFGFEFQTAARVSNPTIVLWSPVTANTSANVYGQTRTSTDTGAADIPSTNWTEIQKSATGVSFNSNNYATTLVPCAGTAFQNAWIFYHFTKDARLGIVN